MEIIKIQNLNFFYSNQETKAIDDFSMSIKRGEFVVICGPSGCGKSTLLRQMKTVLAPHGLRSGEIVFEGKPLEEMDQRTQSLKIGFVQQNPDNQIVTDKVWHELAFGLESLGFDTPTIRCKVAEMASFFGIHTWFHKNVTELSGGQKQLLNLAAVMVMSPSVLILDEPTSQLDPIAASEFLAMLGKINRELGITVILTEHRLEEAFPLATTVGVMDKGKLLCSGTAKEVGLYLKDKSHSMFLAMPSSMRVWAAVDNNLDCPVTVREGKDWLKKYSDENKLKELLPEKGKEHSDEVAITAKELWFKYEKDSAEVIKGLSLYVKKGEFLAILGGNGAGKTTALKLLAGLYKPCRGSVQAGGKIGVLPQAPQTLFLKKTVREDLFEIFSGIKISKEEKEKRVAGIVRLCRLEDLLERHPYDLSGGEQQRLALSKVLLGEPDILLMDEPTKGLDAEFKQELAEILRVLLDKGVSVIMVSHDLEFCAHYAHTCGLMFDGNIVTQASPRKFFSDNSFYTTSVNRFARDFIPEAITPEDLIIVCGGESPKAPEISWEEFTLSEPIEHTSPPINKISKPLPGRSKMSKRTIVATVLILLLIPMTLLIGETYLEGRKYYFISMLILLESMIPFFMIFESRKPQPRELVIIAVLCAIGVAGRAVFFMLPQFKPVMALTIIAGVALGAETGFLVGAMTMLASNVLFSQGPWTPWQMFSMGIIGFLAGVLFRKGLLSRKRLYLCIFGALSAILIYGGIMNPAAAIMWASDINWQIIMSYYISGFPMDCIHAVATWIFLWFAAEPMLEKLNRIKVKYGLIE